jgi:two-component system cell cycle sensor histidine kinase/response regulator CckA
MPGQLRVLIVEDSEDDAALLLRELRRGRWEVIHERVDTPQGMTAALNAHPWDLIIADYIDAVFQRTRRAGHGARTFGGHPVHSHIRPGRRRNRRPGHAGRRRRLPVQGKSQAVSAGRERELRDAEGRRKAEHTERQLQKGERQLADAQRLAHLGTWHVDLRTNVAVWSDEACRILGCQPAKRV